MHKNSYKKAEKDNLGRDKNEKNQNRYFSILVDGNYWISSKRIIRLRMFLKDIGLIIQLIILLMLVLLKVIIMDIMAVID